MLPEQKVLEYCQALGVSEARLLPAARIPVNPELAGFCGPNKCPNYGLNANCPPNGPTPGDFLGLLPRYQTALVFRFDLPTGELVGEGLREAGRLVQQSAAQVEARAASLGLARARAFGAGSCRWAFCGEFEYCQVLDGNGQCRFPDGARPSISGIGVDFLALSRLLGWKPSRITADSDPKEHPVTMMTGLVLLD